MNFFRILIISVFLLFSFTVSAQQVTASFTTNTTQGCPTLTVNFNNTSSGSGVLTYLWDFGNGTTSPFQNPSAFYSNPGVYTVSLIVSNGTISNNDTAYLTINVFNKPVVDFTSDVQIGCDNLTVQFTDLSVSGGATINNWTWAFGDGGGSTQQNPSHTYSTTGTYSVYLGVINVNGCSSDTTMTGFVVVSPTPTNNFTADITNKCIPPLTTNFTGTASGNGALTYIWDFGDGSAPVTSLNASHEYTGSGHFNVSFTATDQYGCSNTVAQNSFINITPSSMPPPVIQFTADITASCDTPLSVVFTNSSTGTAPLSYIWHFGDGAASNQQNPAHIYTTNGNYDVSLVVTDGNGCSDSLFQNNYVNIAQIFASFDITEGDTVCQDQLVHLTNTSGSAACSWNYGNGQSGTGNTTSTNYITLGTKTITMIAEPGTSCADTITGTIYVSPLPSANFTIFNEYGCDTPHNVSFISTGSNISSWGWSFGDGDSSYIVNPAHTYDAQGDFFVNLTVTDSLGCQSSKKDTVHVNFPVARMLIDTNRACIPLPIIFDDISTFNQLYDNIDTTYWDFGDGHDTIQADTITHVYDVDGDYWAYLDIVTDFGCTSRDSVRISVGDTLNLNFLVDHSAIKVIACAQDSIYITNLTTDSTLIDSCFWEFGPVLTSMLDNPLPFVLHNTIDTGYVTLQLITIYNGCRDTLTRDSSLYINGPVIKNVSIALNRMSCSHDSCYVYYLTTNTQATEYWKWNWRDSTLFDSLYADTVRHQYVSTGNRLVRVWAHNDSTGCVYRDSITIKPRDIRANFDSLAWNDSICYTPNGFEADTYKDAVSWKWDFGDGSAQTGWGGTTSTHLFDTAGIYSITLFSRTDNELQCVDTISKPILVFKPEVDFYADTLIGCAQSPITVPFHSTAFSPGTKIDIFTWTFGDGQTGTDSIPVNAYSIPGKFNVTLQVTDSFGCINSLTKNNYITSLAVTADFHPSPLNYCTHAPVTFTSTSTSIPADYPPVHFHWDFGNGASSDSVSPIYNYDIKGNYVVTLVVSDTLGCYDSLINITDTIKVQDIVASFTADTFLTCYTQDILMAVNGTLTEYNPTFLWAFGDGLTSSSSEDTVYHQYNLPGNYDIILNAFTEYGCSDSDTLSIHVDGPFARISIDTNQVCKGDSVTFTLADTISVFSYQWFFGDGLDAITAPVSHQYNYVPPSGLFHVLLVYNSPAQNCQQTADTLINIYQVIAGFSRVQQGSTPGDTSGCTPLPVVCTDLSTGATTWNWDFGDGSTSNAQNPAAHSFVNTTQSNKTYDISLIISNAIGCTDTASWPIVVNPEPDIFISNDTTICRGATIQIHALGGNTVSWTPVSNLSSTSTAYTFANPVYSTTYTAQIQSIYGCTNSDTVRIIVQQTPQLTVSRDTAIIVGEYVDLKVTSDIQDVTYQWIPETALTCSNCPDPTARPMATTPYIIRVKDNIGCPYVEDTVRVRVRYEFSVDVPTVFTPNGDEHNETIYVKGWGIKKMNLFKIFNRWGQLVFETDDIKTGWSGMYNGKIQPSDTYTYFVEVELFDGNTMNKKGTFNLLR